MDITAQYEAYVRLTSGPHDSGSQDWIYINRTYNNYPAQGASASTVGSHK